MRADLEQPLARLLDSLAGSPVESDAREALATWIDLVESFNRRMDLTAARGTDELCDLLVADAVVLAGRIAAGARVVDVGSGAGAPGLPLALLRPDLQVQLVEPAQKRVAAMRSAVGRIFGPAAAGRAPAVRRQRGEDLVKEGLRFDVAVSRATLPPDAWLPLGAKLAPEGKVWVLLAEAAPPSLAGWRVVDDVAYRWPLTDRPRRAVCYALG